MKRNCKHVSAAEIAAYDAPFPFSGYRAGARRFPSIVPKSADSYGVTVSLEAAEFFRATSRFEMEDIFMAVGMQDPVLGPKSMETLAKLWKNGCYYHEVGEDGHFVQEWGAEIAQEAIEVFEGKPQVGGKKPRRVQVLKEKL